MATIGKQDATSTTDLENRTVDTMTGDGSDTTLVLSSTPISINNVLVFISGVLQRPTTDYTLSGTTITFSEAPITGLKVVAITGGGEHIGIPLTRLDASKFSNSAVTDAKIATGISASKLTGALPSLDGSALTGASGDNISGVDTVSANDPTITTNPASVGHIWLNRVAGGMFVCTDNTVGANVWTNVGEGSGGVQNYISATGGSITTDGDYKVHTFNDSGTFTPTVGIDASLGNVVEYLVVAGGGGGAKGQNGNGGGGAGGMRSATGFSVSATNYTVTVGGGGTGATSTAAGGSGQNSIFSSITSIGGGGGGGGGAATTGGSGGGGGGTGSTHASGASGTVGQGNAGGTGTGSHVSGGGGGKGAVGGNSTGGDSGTAGSGGAGEANDIKETGTNVFYAGGGGGGVNNHFSPTAGSGGNGGGGAGATNGSAAGIAGTENLGGGGGGGGRTSGSADSNGGNGGKGVVIIRYKFQ